MQKSDYISIASGSAVATTLAIIWRLVNTARIPMSTSGMMLFSRVTLCVWPSSLMLMETDPQAPLDFGRVAFYLTAIFLNGLLYAVIVAVVRKVSKF
jgi:hypothetical protein